MNAATDLLRLVCLPVLGWAAYRDLETRRVSNRVWPPLVILGIVLLAWDTWRTSTGSGDGGLFGVRVALSVGVVAALGFVFWWAGAFGGADAKALATICILFPTTPVYAVGGTVVPIAETSGVFSLSVLTNAVFAAAVVPPALFIRNALAGRVSLVGFVGHPVSWSTLSTAHGRLLAGPNGLDGGLDLDALRMYLAWRGESLAELRAMPELARDPASLPADPHPPGDGTVEPITDGGCDPWGAAAFLAAVDGDAYGTTPARLRGALDAAIAAERLWITPGIPFLVALVFGLSTALCYGDMLYVLVDGF